MWASALSDCYIQRVEQAHDRPGGPAQMEAKAYRCCATCFHKVCVIVGSWKQFAGNFGLLLTGEAFLHFRRC